MSRALDRPAQPAGEAGRAWAGSGSEAGTGPSRGPMSVRTELRRQARRRRTRLALLAVVVLPIVLTVALYFAAPPAPRPGERPMLLDVATRSGLNLAFFVLAAASQFLLVVVVALFCGDTVASEASWGSLRYLLVRPVARSALLRTKLTVAVTYALLAVVLVPASGLAAGSIAFGWHGVQAPLGLSLPAGTGLLRLLAATAFVAGQLACVAALAFLFSVLTDAPLGAVGGAVVVMIVSQILDAVTPLGVLRSGLPTHYGFAWVDLLVDPVRYDQMLRGVVVQLAYAVPLLALARWRFGRKDILS